MKKPYPPPFFPNPLQYYDNLLIQEMEVLVVETRFRQFWESINN